jgi:hypothetical protein
MPNHAMRPHEWATGVLVQIYAATRQRQKQNAGFFAALRMTVGGGGAAMMGLATRRPEHACEETSVQGPHLLEFVTLFSSASIKFLSNKIDRPAMSKPRAQADSVCWRHE